MKYNDATKFAVPTFLMNELTAKQNAVAWTQSRQHSTLYQTPSVSYRQIDSYEDLDQICELLVIGTCVV